MHSAVLESYTRTVLSTWIVLPKGECSAVICSMLFLFLCYESHYKAVCDIWDAGGSVILINSRDGSAADKLGAF